MRGRSDCGDYQMINWHVFWGRVNQSFDRSMDLVIVMLKAIPISLLVAVLAWFIMSKLEDKHTSLARVKKAATGLAFYTMLLLQMGIFSRPFGSERGIEWIPFMKPGGYYLVILFSLANVIIFIPFGMLITKVFSKVNTWWKAALITFAFSVFVELIQFILACGKSEVEDVIMNVIGGVVGYLVMRKIRKRNNENSKYLEN